MRVMLCRLMAMLLTASPVLAVSAQEYYRWLDSAGTLHVSQHPPAAGVDYEIVSAQTKTVLQKVGAETKPAAAGQPVTAEQLTALQQQVDAVNTRLAQQNCETARHNKARLADDTPLAAEQTDGQTKAMTDEMRAEQLKIAEQQILEFCAPAVDD